MKPLFLGALGGGVVASIGCLAPAMLADHDHHRPVRTPKPMYEIVDDYKGCDLIRYTDHEGCIHYFLHCGAETSGGGAHVH